jgi:hypothetical protein
MAKNISTKKSNLDAKKEEPDYGVCVYIAGRGDKKPCIDVAATPYGFCMKHVRTVQAKKAMEVYELEKNKQPTKVVPTETVTKSNNAKPKAQPTPSPTPAKKQAAVSNIKASQKSVATGERKDIIRTKKIYVNHWGRYEDPETHIVFDRNTKEAYGIQDSSGKVSALKPTHVELCKRNGWDYNLPYDDDDDDDDEDSVHESDFDETDESEDFTDDEDEDDSEEYDDSDEEDEEEEEEDEYDDEEDEYDDEEDEYDDGDDDDDDSSQ